MIKHLDHLNMTVANLDETLRWYADLFDFQVQERGTWNGAPWAIVKSGEALLCLYEYADFDRPSARKNRIHGLNHFALRVTDGPAFQARAEKLGVKLNYEGPVDWPHSTAFYVNDPTGHEIEVAAWDDDVVAFT
jgi:catechol 2,3-dioxygenase-like lactoylglutathione lyase family enzyme